MSKLNRFVTPLIAVAMMSSVPMMTQAQATQATSTQSTAADFNAPAPGTEEYAAYKDGMDAAKLDTLAKRKIDAKVSHLYVHPPVKGQAKEKYRTNFEQGYQKALKNGATS